MGGAPPIRRLLTVYYLQVFLDGKGQYFRESLVCPLILEFPVLLMVTQSNHVEIVHRFGRIHSKVSFQVMRAPLYTRWDTNSSNLLHPNPPLTPSGNRQCYKAAIGVSHNRNFLPSGCGAVNFTSRASYAMARKRAHCPKLYMRNLAIYEAIRRL